MLFCEASSCSPGLNQFALGPQLKRGSPAQEGAPNYIASLLCRESVDGSQEAVGRVPPDNFRTSMGFLYITDSIFCFSALVIIYFVLKGTSFTSLRKYIKFYTTFLNFQTIHSYSIATAETTRVLQARRDLKIYERQQQFH